MAVDPTQLNQKPLVDRSRLLSIVGGNADFDLGPPDDEDIFEPIQIGARSEQPSVPAEAAAPGAAAAESEASSPPPVAPPPEPPAAPSYDYEAENRELRGLLGQFMRSQEQDREYWRQAHQAQQPKPEVPQHDPEQYLQRQHLNEHFDRFGMVENVLGVIVQKQIEADVERETSRFERALSKFTNNPDYPDFDKHVTKASLDGALSAAQSVVRSGKKFPEPINWEQLMMRDYRDGRYSDLEAANKQRIADEAKRAEHAKKLDAVGGTPRSGGAYQQPVAKSGGSQGGARIGDGGFNSRIVDFIRSANYGD